MKIPECFHNEEELEEFLSQPSESLVEMMKRLDGDIMILGIAGKMGVTMGKRAVNAIRRAGVSKTVYGVSRFSRAESRTQLEAAGVKTIPCNLLDQDAVNALPQVANIIFMAGKKFGTEGAEDSTWAMNTLAPAYVAKHFSKSRIVAFSTGCVYPLVSVVEGGCTEEVPPQPIGEYSQSCLGRERIFQYASREYGTKVLLFRLNYAIDMRYGVLHDIARQIANAEAVNNTVGHFNVIWQGDANDRALLCLEHCTSPAAILNITGPETASIEQIAAKLAREMGKEFSFSGRSADRCYLNNSARMCDMFGYPSISLERMILWQAQWIKNGGSSLGKPTHFEVNNGKF